MARIHKCFDRIIGCACSDVIVEQSKGIHMVELSEEGKPIALYYSDIWEFCPKCKSNFIPEITTYNLHKSGDSNFGSILDSVQTYHKPIYEWFVI